MRESAKLTQTKGFIVSVALGKKGVFHQLRPEKSFSEAVMRAKRFMPPVGPPGVVLIHITHHGVLLAEYTSTIGELRIMGEFADQKESSRTPFGEKELMLDEDTIFQVVSVRQMADGSKWFLDVSTRTPTTVYGTWEPQPNGTKKLIRATTPVQDLVISFNPLPYRDKNMAKLKELVEKAGEVGYGPMRLVKVGRSIDVDDADDKVKPEQQEIGFDINGSLSQIHKEVE